MSLKDWLASGWLVEHKTNSKEISDLFRVADRDLKDCQESNLSLDWRLSIAYNAALQLARAALAAEGFRAGRASHHYRVIQSLAYTIKADDRIIVLLDQFRKKRNISDYDRAGTVSKQEVREMINLAMALRADIEDWIRSKHPELLAEE